MSGDRDAEAILRGHSIPQVAVAALKDGSDYLLIADIDDPINIVVSALVTAVESGDLEEARLEYAGAKIHPPAAKHSR